MVLRPMCCKELLRFSIFVFDKISMFTYVNLWIFFICDFLINVPIQSPFSHHHFPLPHLPPAILPPLALSMGPLYMFLDDPSLPLPHYISLPLPLGTVSLFFISMSLVLFCSLVCFVDYVPPIGEVIWYLSFTTWLISLSIMLSRSIYAVVKGRSSFFLSAV